MLKRVPVSDSSLPLSVECRPFAAWPEAWWLRHGELELVFVPAVARLVRLARGSDAPNALWLYPEAARRPVEGWENAGGEKIWFWPQRDWRARMGRGWPPPELRAVETRAEPRGLSWLLPAHAGFGLALRRELRFAAEDPAGFRLVTRVLEDSSGLAGTARVTPWSVTQIPKPSGPLRVGAAAGATWRAMFAPAGAPEPAPLADGGWAVACPEAPAFKHGFAADAIRAPTAAGALTISVAGGAEAWPAGLADAGLRAQIYSTAPGADCLPPGAEPYVELEFLAPPGAREWTLEWRLE